MIVENMNNENFLGKPRYNFSKRTFPNETNVNLTNDSGVESSINDFNSTANSSTTSSSFLLNGDPSQYTFTKNNSNMFNKTNPPTGLKLKQLKKSNSNAAIDFNGKYITKKQAKLIKTLKKKSGTDTLKIKSGNYALTSYQGTIPNSFPMRSSTYDITSSTTVAMKNLKPVKNNILGAGLGEGELSPLDQAGTEGAESLDGNTNGSYNSDLESGLKKSLEESIPLEIAPGQAKLGPGGGMDTDPIGIGPGGNATSPGGLGTGTAPFEASDPSEPKSTSAGTNGTTTMEGDKLIPSSAINGVPNEKVDNTGSGNGNT